MNFIYLTQDSTLEGDRKRILVNPAAIMCVSPIILTSRVIEDGKEPIVGSTIFFNAPRQSGSSLGIEVVETVEEVEALLFKEAVSPHLGKRARVQLRPETAPNML